MVLDVKSAEWRNVNKHEREERKAWENSFWINDTYQLHPKVTASLGFRLGTFSNLGGPHYYEIDEDGNIVWMYKTRKNRIVNTQVTCEPRASLCIYAYSSVEYQGGLYTECTEYSCAT